MERKIPEDAGKHLARFSFVIFAGFPDIKGECRGIRQAAGGTGPLPCHPLAACLITTRNISPVWNDAENDLQSNYSYQMMWLKHGFLKMNVIRLNLTIVIHDTDSSNFY